MAGGGAGSLCHSASVYSPPPAWPQGRSLVGPDGPRRVPLLWPQAVAAGLSACPMPPPLGSPHSEWGPMPPPQLAAQSRPILTPLPGVGAQRCIDNHSVWKHAPHAAHLLPQPGRPGARSSGCGDCHSPLTCQSVTTLKSRCNQLKQRVRSPSGNKQETACSCWRGGKHSGGTDGGYPRGTLTGSRQQCPGHGLGHRSPESRTGLCSQSSPCPHCLAHAAWTGRAGGPWATTERGMATHPPLPPVTCHGAPPGGCTQPAPWRSSKKEPRGRPGQHPRTLAPARHLSEALSGALEMHRVCSQTTGTSLV